METKTSGWVLKIWRGTKSGHFSYSLCNPSGGSSGMSTEITSARKVARSVANRGAWDFATRQQVPAGTPLPVEVDDNGREYTLTETFGGPS